MVFSNDIIFGYGLGCMVTYLAMVFSKKALELALGV